MFFVMVMFSFPYALPFIYLLTQGMAIETVITPAVLLYI